MSRGVKPRLISFLAACRAGLSLPQQKSRTPGDPGVRLLMLPVKRVYYFAAGAASAAGAAGAASFLAAFFAFLAFFAFFLAFFTGAFSAVAAGAAASAGAGVASAAKTTPAKATATRAATMEDMIFFIWYLLNRYFLTLAIYIACSVPAFKFNRQPQNTACYRQNNFPAAASLPHMLEWLPQMRFRVP